MRGCDDDVVGVYYCMCALPKSSETELYAHSSGSQEEEKRMVKKKAEIWKSKSGEYKNGGEGC